MDIKIVLGSTRDHKLNAVREACTLLDWEASVSGISADSGQNEQPVGLDETFRGALARAEAVKAKHPDSIAIGIETGIFRTNSEERVTLDISVIIVLALDGRRIITTGTGIEFPEEYVRAAEASGFENTTVGSIINKSLGGEKGDPYSPLTRGRVSRTKTLVDGLMAALVQL